MIEYRPLNPSASALIRCLIESVELLTWNDRGADMAETSKRKEALPRPWSHFHPLAEERRSICHYPSQAQAVLIVMMLIGSRFHMFVRGRLRNVKSEQGWREYPHGSIGPRECVFVYFTVQ